MLVFPALARLIGLLSVMEARTQTCGTCYLKRDYRNLWDGSSLEAESCTTHRAGVSSLDAADGPAEHHGAAHIQRAMCAMTSFSYS